MKKTVTGILVILVVIISVTAYLNRASIADKKELQEEAILIIKENGTEIKQVDFNFINELEEVTFNKELDTSDSTPVDQRFTGVLLHDILSEAGVSLEEKGQVTVKAIDGYMAALSIDEVLSPDNVYLVYKNNGEFLKGKSEGGTGPYRIVIREDQFGQRWCKFVTEVDVK